MTSFAITLGCALLAFSPTLSLLLLFAYSKAQLVIIVTTSSFFQLLACLLAALLHLPFKSLSLGAQGIFVIIPTSVIAQALSRCAFVHCYHKVETVIEKSIARHEQLQRQSHSNSHARTNSNSNNNNNNDGENNINANDNVNVNVNEGPSESQQLKLELNDVSSGIAAGVGFAFFHTVMLYGTLLASENSRTGTLYQESCTMMPSIFNSAIMAFFFGILDLVWMLMTFYGMRRIRDYRRILAQRHQVNAHANANANNNINNVGNSRNENVNADALWSVKSDKIGGKAALALVVVTHFAAAFATVPNQTMPLNGCVVALPCLAFVTVVTVVAFWFLFKKSYLPQGQQQRIRQSRHLD